MSVFADYARYYDLLYRDKPYREEADYIRGIIDANHPGARNLVELGCGSGVHAEYLARSGLAVTGTDLSKWMLDRANARRAVLPDDVAQRLCYTRGDVRSVRLGVTADAVISLFHVVSYQAENSDLQAMFTTAREHLNRGGIFVFDVWYGPAVLTDRPAVRVKEMEDEQVRITRVATPTLHAARNQVDVQYRVLARDKATGVCIETEESHRMRYLFSPEIEWLAGQSDMAVIDSHEWMSGRTPGYDTWSVCFVCRVNE